jgi:hypothetical protein
MVVAICHTKALHSAYTLKKAHFIYLGGLWLGDTCPGHHVVFVVCRAAELDPDLLASRGL